MDKNERKGIIDRLTYAYVRRVKKWMFCPECQKGKMTIDKQFTEWTCVDCGYKLSADAYEDNYVFWYCDECHAYLNNQEGFDCNESKHICRNCGYENDISVEHIKGRCVDCGKVLSDANASLCSDCRQIRREKAKRWLVTAGKVAVGLAVAAGAVILAITSSEEDGATEDETVYSNDSDTNNKTLYATQEIHGHGKQNYYWNEYRLENGEVVKHRCHRQKIFDGDESEWREDEKVIDSWTLDDPNMPEWLHKYL